MANRIAGIIFVKADGVQFQITGSVEAPLSPVTRETVMAVGGVAGYKETAQEPYLTIEAAFTPDISINTLVNSTNMTVTAECANGRVYTLTGAYVRAEPKADPIEGKLNIEFAGLTGNWS